MNNMKLFLFLTLFIIASTYAGLAMINNAEKATNANPQVENSEHEQPDNKEDATEDDKGEQSDEEEEKPEVKTQFLGNTTYDVSVKYDPETKKIKGTMIVKAINDTGSNQDSIYFHIYPKIYEEEASLEGEDWDFVFGEDRQPGNMEVYDVKVMGELVTTNINGTIMEVPLQQWNIDEEITIEMGFEIEVPKNDGVFSYDKQSTWFGSWLPMKAVYTDEGWYLNPYHAIGDPLYSDIATYNMEITIPKEYQIATSGNDAQAVITEEDEMTNYSVVGHNMRDFAMVIMDQSYGLLQSQVDGINVNVWYRNQSKATMQKYLEATEKSLTYFGERYGKYPYKEYDVIATGGFFGGMEYPGLVFIQSAAFEKDLMYSYKVIAHETAHQWWYALVGNNAIEDPWLDESLTNYSTLRFLLDEYKQYGDKTLKDQERYLAELIEEYKEDEQYIGLAAKDFAEWETYILSIYYFGSQMFYQLEQIVGEEKMNEALAEYVKQYSYKNATREDFITVFEEVVGPEVRPYFEAWLKNEEVRTIEQ